MPLQFRRGTEAERAAMTQPLAAGEPLYITDEQKVYVGDGSTVGGILVTSNALSNVQPTIAAMFTESIAHANISFVYDDSLQTISATVDLSNYSGIITADSFNGSIINSDSSILYDSVTGNVFLSGVVASTISAVSDSEVDLGTSDVRFKDLYLSGDVIAESLSATTLFGDLSGSVFGNLTGDVKGSVFGDDSSVIVDAVNNSITADTVTANVVSGNLQGSLFGEDSSIIVDAVNNTIQLGTTVISGQDGLILFGDETTAAGTRILNDNTEQAVEIFGISETFGGETPTISISSSRGSLANPEALENGDSQGLIIFSGWDGVVRTYGGYVTSVTDSTISSLSAVLRLGVSNGIANNKYIDINENGNLSAPEVTLGSVATGDLPDAPTAGTMVFDSTSNQFKGWNGSTWVVLG